MPAAMAAAGTPTGAVPDTTSWGPGPRLPNLLNGQMRRMALARMSLRGTNPK